jgi:methylmalonyl-CoA mutase
MTIAGAPDHVEFPHVDRDAWRARSKLDAAALSPEPGIEGIAIAPLYDAPPATALVVPARVRMACLAALPADIAAAVAIAGTIAEGEVDGVVLGGPRAATTADRLPLSLPCWIEHCPRAPAREVTAWLADPCLPDPFLADAAHVDAAHVDAAHFDAAHVDRALGADAASLADRLAQASGAVWLCDGAAWHDQGASAVDELAIALCGMLAAIRGLAAHGLDADVAVRRTLLRAGLSGEVLLDVAKLRALRALVHAMLGFLGVHARPRVHARTCRRVRSRRDADTNLVRATYETFAAAAGGVDALVVEPHARAHEQPADVQRWARNLVHIARLESHLDTVDDPFGGAWAVEHLTADLADAAWRKVVALEHAGGLASEQVRAGLVADVAATAEQRRQRAASGAAPIVGVSKFAPPSAASVPDDPVPWLDLCRAFESEVTR